MATTLTAQPTASTSLSTSARAIKWMQSHRRLLIVVAGIVVAAILVSWFLVTARTRREAFATRALNQARGIAESGNIPAASTELQKVIDTYRGTEAAIRAEIALNQLRLISGQSELAVVRLREFVASHPESQFLAAGNALLGAALENSNKPAEAGDAYTAASAAALQDYLKADYLVQAARAYALGGKNTEAVAALRTVLDKYSETPAKVEAQVRLSELTKGEM